MGGSNPDMARNYSTPASGRMIRGADRGQVLGIGWDLLRLRETAGRLVGPFAVEPDHAELDAIADAEHPGVLGDRVIHRAPHAVGDEHRGAAGPPRNGAGRPGLPRHLLDFFKSDDLEVGVPELSLLGAEAALDHL